MESMYSITVILNCLSPKAQQNEIVFFLFRFVRKPNLQFFYVWDEKAKNFFNKLFVN
ncbi:hypothetical protein C943_01338 [Mariniradius saccharolyticus AK6]|uniref:Uncharacterized protein n=1 Tax=Mariniradius saccharolyticus AK6 TaxID=1239962 RepID=M7Y491_9BACT|nr:hypothetical protein C943_01338 [Mariniradius saccharolyticus AK6]